MLLFVLAHQDDEIFVMTRLLDAVRRAEDIAVVYLTDGGARSARRDRESRHVLEKAGVAPHRILFVGSRLGLPDGALHRHLERAYGALAETLDTLPRPRQIITHAWEGGHHDHDCVHALTVLAARARGLLADVAQMPFYREVRRLGNYFAPMAPLAENGPVTKAYRPWGDVMRTLGFMLAYRTQWRTFRWHGPAMLMRRLATPWDSLQPADPRRLGMRPHDGRLYYERMFNTRWEEVSSALAALAARLALPAEVPPDAASRSTAK